MDKQPKLTLSAEKLLIMINMLPDADDSDIGHNIVFPVHGPDGEFWSFTFECRERKFRLPGQSENVWVVEF